MADRVGTAASPRGMASANDTVTTLPTAAPAPAGAAVASRVIPHSQDAEQALLGALLLNNQLYHEIDGLLRPDHFYVPAHGRVFEAIGKIINRQQVADPVSLTSFFGKDSWYQEIGGRAFLEQINENASTVINIRTYADIIYNHALTRELISIGTDMVNAAYDDGGNEPQNLIGESEARLFDLAERGHTKNEITDLKRPLVEVVRRVEYAMQNRGDVTGVTSGFSDLDKLLGGFQNSDLVILAARPSMGKTALALNMALNAARARDDNRSGGAGVGVFSLEMSSDQLAARMLANEANISMSDLSRGQTSGDMFGRIVTASDTLSRMPIYIDETSVLNVATLRARARRLKRQYNIGMLVVDYLQLMRSAGKIENRVQEISEISQGLKSIARELNIPVIALSQLSRGVESRDNKRPQLSDLRESGSIEQDADIVMFLYREEYYLDKLLPPAEQRLAAAQADDKVAKMMEQLEKVRGKAELLISKNRKGPTGAIALSFQAETTTFHNYTDAPRYD